MALIEFRKTKSGIMVTDSHSNRQRSLTTAESDSLKRFDNLFFASGEVRVFYPSGTIPESVFDIKRPKYYNSFESW